MAYRSLGINTSRRRATLRNIVTSLLKHGQIETTEARAKELNSLAEKMISLGKRGDLAARRQALSFLMDEAVVKELFDQIGPKYADRQGGFTKIMKTGYRRGDAAEMVLVKLVD